MTSEACFSWQGGTFFPFYLDRTGPRDQDQEEDRQKNDHTYNFTPCLHEPLSPQNFRLDELAIFFSENFPFKIRIPYPLMPIMEVVVLIKKFGFPDSSGTTVRTKP